MKKIVVGIGNDIMGDDAAGLRVIDILKNEGINVDFEKVYSHGMDIAERIVGYDYAIIVDSSPQIPPGSVAIVDENFAPLNFDSPHTLSIRAGVEILRKLGEKVPKIKIVLIGVENIQFKEGLSSKVEEGVVRAVDIVKKIIKGDVNGRNCYIL